MARARGFKDWIPTSGEGRALVEVKGRIGGKGGSMRRRSSMSALRAGKETRKRYIRCIPLAPGPMSGNVIGQTHRTAPHGGTASTQIRAEWLWALTPEVMDYGGQNVSPLWADGVQAGDSGWATTRLRLVGVTGDLYYTPQLPSDGSVGAEANPAAYSGFVGWSWIKFDAGAATSVGSGSNPTYPWQLFTAGTNTTGIDAAGLTPTLAMLTDPSEIQYRDYRWRRGRVMFSGYKPWRIINNYQTQAVSAGESNDARLLTTGYQPVKIPLPRKLLVNVGRGEAVGVIIWSKDHGQSVEDSGSPVARLDWHNVSIKAYELD